jgi:CheY-like chemotaxis protein
VRLAQIICNLLNNASRNTGTGGKITITLEREEDDAILRVKDTGVGIPPEALPKIFDMFTQVDRSLGRAQGGLGIGLSLVRGLVELHGGSISAHSEGAGRGSEFVIRLPLTADVVADMPAPVKPRHSDPRRVLVVEDNPDAAESLTVLLEVLGHRVRAVHDGVGALEVARANVPDVMLVDIGLPGIDGFEVARRIRRITGGDRILLVALTGYGREEDRERTQKAGFDYHLTKPVEVDALEGLVARIALAEAGEKRSTLQ